MLHTEKLKEGVLVPMEHERRFFPDVTEFIFNSVEYEKVDILQGYLEDILKTRLRAECDSFGEYTYWQTRKSGSGISRHEDEQEITKEAFEHGWKDVKYHLSKDRYFVPVGNVIAEVNIFQGRLYGYIQIEVEFPSHQEAIAFIPSAWFGKEVTDDKKHGNYYLAKYGCKKLLPS
jgi:CYTH domain-containing protein